MVVEPRTLNPLILFNANLSYINVIVPFDSIQQKWQCVIIFVADLVTQHPDKSLLLLGQLSIHTSLRIHNQLKLVKEGLTRMPVLKNSKDTFGKR